VAFCCVCNSPRTFTDGYAYANRNTHNVLLQLFYNEYRYTNTNSFTYTYTYTYFRTALAHSTRTKSTDPVYGSVSYTVVYYHVYAASDY